MSRIIPVIFILILLLGNNVQAATGISGDTQINQCQQKTYLITVTNDSGNNVDQLVATNDISALTGFSFVSGTSTITGPGCSTTANPTLSGTDLIWDIDSMCGVTTLADSQSITIEYDLITNCNAISGSQNVKIDYQMLGNPQVENGSQSIEVLPGAVTITKTPSVQSAAVGDNVTWTLEIENSGLGTIANVQVSDVLGAGLQYVSDTKSGINAGQTTTWGPAQIAPLASINPGDTVSITLVAKVIACDNLDNDADVSWGCDLVTPCFNTAGGNGTATASVQRLVRTPVLGFSPPDVSFSYCGDSVPDPVAFNINNSGDGAASSIQTLVDFDPLLVSNVSAGAAYDSGQDRFTLSNPIAAGGSYNLNFELAHSNWCSGTFPNGTLVWQKVYKDECGNDFYPPVELSTLTPPADSPSLAVNKTGAPSAIQIGDSVTYDITSSYSGAIACGGGNTGQVTVIDTLPDGFTVTNDGGGVWVPGAGGTGGTITWNYTPPASLNTAITLASPDVNQCQTYCFTTFTNTVSAQVTDCCTCSLSSSASQTTAIECEAFLSSNKTATPATVERCDAFTYTNTYQFDDDAALDSILLNALSFEEQAENNQQYVPGSLSVTLTGSGDITACATAGMIDSTPGGSLVLDFSNCAAVSVRNKTLEIIYNLTATQATAPACSSKSFYSWSSLNLGSNPGGNDCLGDNTIHETTIVSIDPPAMNLSIGSLGSVINSCESKSVTMTLTQSSATADPRDVKLVLAGANYYATNPAAAVCGGAISPVACTPVVDGSGDYIWTFNDAFTAAGDQATITLDLTKRCGGISDLTATAYYDDQCSDDATPDEICSTSATDAPLLMTSGDLIIQKTPEVINAVSSQVQWVIYITNRGDGKAYNVWLDDTLGSGLSFASATVDNMTGVTITANQDHDGAAINGGTIAITEMAPGERRAITLTANLISCTGLTNDASASWGCISQDCRTPVTDNSTVQIPVANLINTALLPTNMAPCANTSGTITLKNAGQTTVYNVQVEQTLPTGLSYIPGSMTWQLNGGGFAGGNNPSPVNPMTWSSTELAALASLDPGDTLEIKYNLKTACDWAGGNSVVSSDYENPCGQVFTSASKSFALTLDAPVITVNKRLVPDNPVSCGQLLEWQIDVANNSSHTIQVIRVEDTLGAAFSFDSALGTYSRTGQVVTWEIANLAAGATTTLTLRANTDSAPCDADTDNSVKAWWGCGIVNGDPADDDYDCLYNIAVTDTQTPSRKPDIAVASIGFAPVTINACNDSTTMTLTIENNGPTDAANNDLVVTLPGGLSYNTGTSAIQCSGVTTDPVADPVITGGGTTLTYYDIADKGNNFCDTIQADGGNDTAVLEFDVTSSCFTGGTISTDLHFFDCCGSTQYIASGSQNLTTNDPDLAITKSPATGQVDCGSRQDWTITVTNNGTGNAQVVRVVDTPGAWLDVDFANSTAGLIDMGGGQYGWEFNNLASGANIAFTLATTLNPDGLPNQADCTATLRQNNIQTIWGCGTTGDAVDNDPRTTGYDCTHTTWSTAPATRLQMPDLQVTAITPIISCSSDGTFASSMTATVHNGGDGQTLANFTVQVTIGAWTGTGTSSANLAAGASVDITIDTTGLNLDCNNCTPYNLSAIADLNNDVCECNETNNTFSTTYTAPIPKLALTAITPAPICNGASSVDVTVVNQGCAAVAAGVQITITGDAVGTGTTSGALAAGGGSEVVTISVGNIACDQSYTITATVDPNSLVCECDAANHTQTTTFASPCCSIDLEKATNGQDADTPTGPYISLGNNVTWSYVVTNTGNTSIDSIVLNDDQRGIITASCPGTSLASGANMTCTVTTPVILAMGNQYANVGSVTGRPVDGGGNPIGSNLTDTDPSHFHVENPSIDIEKATNGQDADVATGPVIRTGDAVAWTYVVTNNGNVPLINVTVVDDKGVAVSCPKTILAAAESMTCTAGGLAAVGQYANIATVTGTPPTGPNVQDNDPSHYIGHDPSIDIEKSTNGQDSDTAPGNYIQPGDLITWSYVVTNNGNVNLVNVAVVDDQGVVVTCPKNALVVAESMTCTASGSSNTLLYANVGSVTATPPFGPDIQDTDPSHYHSAVPSINIEKSTNGVDADSPVGPEIDEGGTVSWTYEVTNDGNIVLNNVKVVDSQGVLVSCPKSVLAVDESMTCTGSGIAVAGQYQNEATVEGQPPGLPVVTASDPSHYFGLASQVVSKSSISIKKEADRNSVTGGDIVSYTVLITNSGSGQGKNVQIQDSLPGGFQYIPGTSLLDGKKITDPSGAAILTWSIDSITSGQTRTLSYQLRAPVDLSPGNYINTASAGDNLDSAVVSGSGDYDNCCLTVDKELLLFQPPVEVVSAQQDIYFVTDMAMFGSWQLANFATIDLNRQDTASWKYKISSHRRKVLARGAQVSRMNIGNLSSRSGLGLGMEYSPDIVGSNRDKRKQALEEKIALMAKETGWQGDIDSLRPLLLEYSGSLPLRQHSEDREWDLQMADRRLSPGAWGMTLLSQSFELARLHSSEQSRDRFLARLLLWQMEEKVSFLWNWLQAQPATKRYLPHLLESGKESPLKLSVIDQSSHLFDQAAVILGLSRFKIVLKEAALPVPEELEELTRQVWNNMDSHFDEEQGIWAGHHTPGDNDDPDRQEQVRVFDILLACLAADSLERSDNSWFTFDSYRKRINAASKFLKQRATDNGGLAETFSLTERHSDAQPATLIATAALIRLEILAGEEDAARQRFTALEKLFWDQDNQLYRNDDSGNYQVNYDPYVMGTFIEMLRALTDSDLKIAPDALSRGLAFVDRIINQAGLQLHQTYLQGETSLPIIAENEQNVRPIMLTDQQSGTGINSESNQVPVLIRRVSLDLLPLAALPQNLDRKRVHTGIEEEQQVEFRRPEHFLSRTKGQLLHTENAALAAGYLAETAEQLKALARKYEDPFFQDSYGLKDLAVASDSLWRNSLLSVAFYYDQGIPLVYAPHITRVAKEKGISSQQALANQMESLAEHYLNGTAPQLPAPIFLEYLQGEPGNGLKNKGWANRLPQEHMSLTGLSQLERSRLRFIKHSEPGTGEDLAKMTPYLAGIAAIQTGAKLEFLLDLLDKSQKEGLKLCPEKIEMIMDSRGQPLSSRFLDPGPSLIGQLSMLLVFADTLALPKNIQETLPDQAILLPRVDRALGHHLAKVLTPFPVDNQERDKNLLLDQGVTLDLLAQLYLHPATSQLERKPLLSLIEAKTEQLIKQLDLGSQGIDVTESMAKMQRERNRLAAYASVLMGLARVQKIKQDPQFARIIASLADDFDHDLWSEKTGCYQGLIKQYRSREMQILDYPYSELDAALSLAALAQSLQYLPPADQERILRHMTSFGNRILVHPQLSSKILADNDYVPADFDSEILQDTDVRLVQHQKPYPGDVIQYRIQVYNRCPTRQSISSPLASVDVQDILPGEMYYIPGSTLIDSEPAQDPLISGSRLRWQLNDVRDVSEIIFSAKLSPGFTHRELKNRVEAIGWQGGDRKSRSCTFNNEIVDLLGSRNSVITVQYYNDSNANNILDKGESGIADITTHLQGQESVTGNQNGIASFRDLSPGIYLVQPDMSEGEHKYIATGLIPVETTVRENEEKTLNVGLIAQTKIEGWVFDDRNNNGKKDQDEPAIHGLLLQLRTNNEYHGYSAVDGFFRISRIPVSTGKDVEIADQQPYAGDLKGIRPGFVLTWSPTELEP